MIIGLWSLTHLSNILMHKLGEFIQSNKVGVYLSFTAILGLFKIICSCMYENYNTDRSFSLSRKYNNTKQKTNKKFILVMCLLSVLCKTWAKIKIFAWFRWLIHLEVKIHSPLNCTKDIKLRWLEYIIFHRILEKSKCI